MSTLTFPQANGSKVPSVPAWQRSSVKTFFTGINWENHSPEVQDIKLSLSDGSNKPLNLKMSVCQFFATVNWDGTAIAAPTAPPSAPIARPPANNNLTLDDFSGLF